MQERTNVKASLNPTLEEDSTVTPVIPVMCDERDGSNADRKEQVDLPTPVSQEPPTKCPPRTNSNPRGGVTDTRTPHDSGRRKREKGQNRRRRPWRNGLADPVARNVLQ